MNVNELNTKLEEANKIIENWANSNGNIEDLPKAIFYALEENRLAIINYIKENEK